MFAAGDIVEVEFPYSYEGGAKQRPALVIMGPNAHGDYTFIMISTQEHEDGVSIGAPDFATSALNAASFVRTSRLITIISPGK